MKNSDKTFYSQILSDAGMMKGEILLFLKKHIHQSYNIRQLRTIFDKQSENGEICDWPQILRNCNFNNDNDFMLYCHTYYYRYDLDNGEKFAQILFDLGLRIGDISKIIKVPIWIIKWWVYIEKIIHWEAYLRNLPYSFSEMLPSHITPRKVATLHLKHLTERKDECGLCREDLNQLHIHHEPEIPRTSYRRGTYDNSAFKWKGEIFTLCQSCHAKVSGYFRHLCVQKIKELDIEKEIWAEVHKKFKY